MTVLSLCFYHSFLFPLFPAVLIIYLFVSVREYLYDIFNGFKILSGLSLCQFKMQKVLPQSPEAFKTHLDSYVQEAA